MRITNSMILNKTSLNINGNKLTVDIINGQMSSQKKISRPSDDPVVAIRALRLRTNLSQINQYYEKNIPDAESWLDVTESAMNNMLKILKDVRTECVNGSTGTLTAEDRQTILKSLNALKEQVYAEGNADYAGRTVFSGYRTDSQITFGKDEENTVYQIEQKFSSSQIEEHRYYSGEVTVPKTASDITNTSSITGTEESTYNRVRLSYDGITGVNSIGYSYGTTEVTYGSPVTNADGSITYTAEDQNGNPVLSDPTDPTSAPLKLTVFEDEKAWQTASGGVKSVGQNDMVFLKDSGELIIGKTMTDTMKSNDASITVDYDKKGFVSGELRPEYYFNCSDTTDPANIKQYTKFDANGNEIFQDIDYTVAMNQNLNVNTQASSVFDSNIYQDIVEMTDAVQKAIDAHAKVDEIKSMMDEVQYKNYEAELNQWLDAAKQEADYADSNLEKLFTTGITDFDGYMQKVNLALTDVGTKGDRLEMTKNRMCTQQTTVEELKSSNEDRELSDIIIDYTAAYMAYQSSLLAASKVQEQTLLNYI